uniref:chitinase n=1 Tax=Boechera stricta TaxID=72658 RepID=Q1L0Q6_BOEST|nr:At3g12500-like protein [Boechera stricta]
MQLPRFGSSLFLGIKPSNVVVKQEEHSVPTVYVAASLDGAVTPNHTVSSLAAKASALPAVLLRDPRPPAIFRASFQVLSSMICLSHRNDAACPARGFYTYNAFITAAKSFPGFGTTGDTATRKKEIAAFFGQTSHETTGGWASAPDGPFSWGYCFKQEQNPTSNYCEPSATWPCAPGKRYYGRGPMQLSWNYNYGLCGRAIGVDLLNNPVLSSQRRSDRFQSRDLVLD